VSEFIGAPTADLPSPALIIDLDALDRNIDRMASWARETGIAVRPHAKSHKCPQIARKQIEAGAAGICCATVREAEIMAAADIPGILLTTPAAPNMAPRIAALAKQRPDFACVIDGAAQMAALVAATTALDVTLPTLVDLDVGLGRTGVVQAAEAAQLAAAINAAPSLSFEGVQAYMGHVQHINDKTERAAAIAEGTTRLGEMRAAMLDVDLAPGLVSGGGTGSHLIDAANGAYGELQVGSYVFMDVQYLEVDIAEDGTPNYEPSLFIETTVINDRHIGYAVTDAGLKSFATDGPLPHVHAGAPAGSSYRYLGDEHGQVIWPEQSNGLRYGDRLRCLATHCDPTVNLYDEFYVIQNDIVVDIWPVAARGHG
jgi:3-hydroxy-D-aspartate aldolase